MICMCHRAIALSLPLVVVVVVVVPQEESDDDQGTINHCMAYTTTTLNMATRRRPAKVDGRHAPRGGAACGPAAVADVKITSSVRKVGV